MTRFGLLAIGFLVMLLVCVQARAEKTIWIDGQGDIHSELKEVPATASESPRVELYVTSWCPYCKKAIRFFESRGIPYTSYNIEQDRSAAEERRRLDSRGGVPFAVINGKKIRGYAPDAYERALKPR